MGKSKRRRARITKPRNSTELKKTKIAIMIIKEVFEEMNSPFGRPEKNVASEITKLIRSKGAGLSFRPIVASGRNSSFIHHQPSNKIVRKNEPVIFDIGAKYQGYCSDITRMHIPKSKEYNDIRAAYRRIKRIQTSLINRALPGTSFRSIQTLYAMLLKSYGYETRHFFGHGVGIDIHERVMDKLEPGMIITVEPGVYLRKFAGCRVEDIILITKNSPIILSESIKPLDLD